MTENPVISSVPARVAEHSEIERMVVELPQRGIDLGVSAGYMLKLAREHSLAPADVATIISLRKEYEAHMGYVSRLLKMGATVEQIHAAYAARETIGLPEPEARRNPDGEFWGWDYSGLSLTRILEFLECFSEGSLCEAEGLGEHLVRVCQDIMDQARWIKNMDMAISFLCLTARRYNVDSIDAAMAVLTGSGFSFLDDEEDEE